VKFIATKKGSTGMTTNFCSPLAFVAVFGSGIRDPGWVNSGSGIRDKRLGSATLIFGHKTLDPIGIQPKMLIRYTALK
jgi:hypothetical protein